MLDSTFFAGKRVLVTGHTGFKGTWLCKILISFGAHVTGYSLRPTTSKELFSQSSIENNMNSVIGDVRDFESLNRAFDISEPEIVFHLAAQPIVIESYKNPRYTYETNVMGTVNILECIRRTESVKSFINVTTDKVYDNNEWEWGYRENDPLGGYDPYSNSKACSELITSSYKQAFFADREVAISTLRSGNVIGGGDFAANRIIPDCIRAAINRSVINIRNPNSIRPYQHVLDPLFAYLLIARKQFQNIGYAGSYNVGPYESDCVTTGNLVDLFCKAWGNGLTWKFSNEIEFHETNFLMLDCSRIRRKVGWKPKWNIEEAVEKTVEWTKAFLDRDDISTLMETQIESYCE